MSSADLEYVTAPANQTRHNVVVAKPVAQVPCSQPAVKVASTFSYQLIFEPETLRASCASLQGTRSIIEEAHGQPFYEPLTNLSHRQVIIPIHTIIAHTSYRP